MTRSPCKRLMPLLISVCVSLVCAAPVQGQQQVQINWVTKKPVSPAITVDKTTPIIVTIQNVNDMLYSYSERVAAVPRAPVDIQPIIGRFGASLAVEEPCKDLGDALDQLDKLFSKPELQPDITNKSMPDSIPLEITKAAYEEARKQMGQLSSHVGGCTAANDTKKTLARMTFYTTTVQDDWDKAEKKPHTFTFSTTLEPLTDYSIFILEQFKGHTTAACTNKDDSGRTVGVECEVVYKPVSTLITASGGFLITQLTSPTYDRSNVPNSTNPVLTVADNGPIRTAFTALINVKVPFCQANDTTWGSAISVGPAFAFGGNNNTTNIGLFTGFSLHLWKYLYITPGVHIGQYPGFPAGFTHAGQSIPPSFTGKLDPINRTTARFAIAITFKGWNLVNSSSTSQGTPANGKPTPSK
jgi:hypothetical protein